MQVQAGPFTPMVTLSVAKPASEGGCDSSQESQPGPVIDGYTKDCALFITLDLSRRRTSIDQVEHHMARNDKLGEGLERVSV